MYNSVPNFTYNILFALSFLANSRGEELLTMNGLRVVNCGGVASGGNES